jgi:iron complex transport system substrate-binding protein
MQEPAILNFGYTARLAAKCQQGKPAMHGHAGESETTTRQHERREIDNMKNLDDITGAVIGAALQLHRDLGPGLLESVYETILARLLIRSGLEVERQKPIDFEYDGIIFDEGFRVDLLVERCVVIELKSVERIAPVHPKQVLTYLRLMRLPVGLLLNFGAATLREGLMRVVNDLDPAASRQLEVNQVASRAAAGKTAARRASLRGG